VAPPVLLKRGVDVELDDRRRGDLEVVDGLAGALPEPVDEQTGDQLLVCRDDEQTCRDLAAQHQVELDRAALGVETPRPTLRVIDGGLSAPGGMVPG
jgi:hypothetical protein